jgi:hypothetical protein
MWKRLTMAEYQENFAKWYVGEIKEVAKKNLGEQCEYAVSLGKNGIDFELVMTHKEGLKDGWNLSKETVKILDERVREFGYNCHLNGATATWEMVTPRRLVVKVYGYATH